MEESPETLCQICFCLLRSPKTLSCGHSICGECLDGVVAKIRAGFSSMPQTNPAGARLKAEQIQANPIITCRVCSSRTPLDRVVDNADLGKRIEAAVAFQKKMKEAAAAAAAGKPVCGFCGKEAYSRCLSCGYLCAEHNDKLHIEGPFTKHKVVPVSVPLVKKEDLIDEPTACIKIPDCPVHKCPLDLVCNTCKQRLCFYCATGGGEHANHSIVSLSASLHQEESVLEETKESLKKRIEAAKLKLDVLKSTPLMQDAEKEQLRQELEKIYSAGEAYLTTCRENSLKQFDDDVSKMSDELEQQIISLRAIASECQCVLESSQRLALDSRVTRYLLFKKMSLLKERLDEIAGHSVGEVEQLAKVEFSKEIKGLLHLADVECSIVASTTLPFIELAVKHIKETFAVNSDIRVPESVCGGAVFDFNRKLIICNDGKHGQNVFISSVSPGSSDVSVLSRVIPFNCSDRTPVFDGMDRVYFFQSNQGENNRWGYLDIESKTFNELPVLPDRSFIRFGNATCDGSSIFTLNSNLEIIEYCLATESWRSTEIKLENISALMCDPASPRKVYALGHRKDGLVEVDLESKTIKKVCDVPERFDLDHVRDVLFARVSKSDFLVFARLERYLWFYESATNEWFCLEEWIAPSKEGAHFCIDPDTRTGYYIGEGIRTWAIAEMSGVVRT